MWLELFFHNVSVCLFVSSVTISLHLHLIGKLKFAVLHRLALGKEKSYAKISIHYAEDAEWNSKITSEVL